MHSVDSLYKYFLCFRQYFPFETLILNLGAKPERIGKMITDLIILRIKSVVQTKEEHRNCKTRAEKARIVLKYPLLFTKFAKLQQNCGLVVDKETYS